MTATCTHCDTTFPHVDCNEDGSPYIEAIRCASPGCEVYLCGATCQELSFACDACGLRFCLSHLILIPDGTDRPLRCCPACATCCKPEIAPQPVPIRSAPRVKYLEVA